VSTVLTESLLFVEGIRCSVDGGDVRTCVWGPEALLFVEGLLCWWLFGVDVVVNERIGLGLGVLKRCSSWRGFFVLALESV
jgi:hypothetical protein